MLQGTGRSFGTFGELLQGCLGSKHLNFLVTFPISCFAYACFVPDAEMTEVTVLPVEKQKARRLATMLLEHYHLPGGGRLRLESDLPVGKGLASSSADLVATARAIAACYGLHIPLSLLMQCMSAIEPSDGVMYHGVVSFYHQQVRLHEFLGTLPPLTILGLDEGGKLDTIEFNRLPKPFTVHDVAQYEHLLERITRAIRQRDLAGVGQTATESALLNQKLNPKQTLGDLLAICRDVQGLGVAVAHSGTCLGLLLSPHHPRYRWQLQTAYNLLATLTKNVLVYHSLTFK
jgi:L-threonine kinase